MEVKDVVFYTITRLGYNGAKYEVYNAKTGSTYIRVGIDRLRISDHAGLYDDYNYIIRTDCRTPAKISGKTVAPAEKADEIIDELIRRYHKYVVQCSVMQTILDAGEYTKAQVKKLDIDFLYGILNLPVRQKQQKPKEYCVEKIMFNPGKFYRFIGA